ncbi:unnamed protein product, partial [Didymodactylos carnosus]
MCAFVLDQLLVKCLLEIPSTHNDIDEMIQTCKFFNGNAAEMQQIDNFEKYYRSEDALKWYTQQSFLFRLLNSALKMVNINVIFKLRRLIQDLCNQLHMLYDESRKQPSNKKIIVYRGLQLSNDELQKLRNNIGNLFSAKVFLSTSLSKDIAMLFAGKSCSPGTLSAVFEIEIDPNMTTKPFADISKFSSFAEEDEVLFSPGSTFQIKDVELLSDGMSLIKLKLCYEEFIEQLL